MKNSIKKEAWYKLQEAVRLGKIKRPWICSSCKKQKIKIAGHHTDYSKPLDVIWLCNSCHRKAHKKSKEKITRKKVNNFDRKFFSELGKAGAAKRWASRYETIKELSGYCNKEWLNYFQKKFSTRQLEALLSYITFIKN